MRSIERVLFVHAHPDDESITTGGTISTLIQRGAMVSVLTCTRGELGEVIPSDLQDLLGQPERLGQHREGELSQALMALGEMDHRYLGLAGARWGDGAPRHYFDSGMQWGVTGPEPLVPLDPGSLCAAEFTEVVGDIVAVIASFSPDIVVSYDENGGYGHPDHVLVHRAALRAAHTTGVPFYVIEPSGIEPSRTDSAGPSVTPSDLLRVDVRPVLERKRAAMAAHRSQILVSGDRFSLSNGVSQPIGEHEIFRFIEGPVGAHPRTEYGVGTRIAGLAAALVVGAGVGALTTIGHQASLEIFGVPIWSGFAVALIVVAALLVGLRLVSDSRWIPGLTGLGIVIAIGVLSLPSAGGSVLVPASPLGYAWAFTPVVIALLVIGWPSHQRLNLNNR